MIPETQDYFMQDENSRNFEVLPTKTYKIDLINGRILGTVDDEEAVMQFIRKVLSTDKYAFEIYDWYYGNELIKLAGRPYDYVVSRIPNIFKEALLVDDRILDVQDFTFNRSGLDAIVVSCHVLTVYGTINYEQEVMI